MEEDEEDVDRASWEKRRRRSRLKKSLYDDQDIEERWMPEDMFS